MSSEFRVRKNRHEEALDAIKSLAGSETVTKSRLPALEGPDHYAFVTTRKFVEATTFVDAMIAWRWILEEDINGDSHDPSFAGEKLGDEDILFSAIAPFVDDGCYIQVFCHDDESIWRWVFEHSQVRREYGSISFEYARANKSEHSRRFRWSFRRPL